MGAIDLRGRNLLTCVTGEISWRRARLGWAYAVAHLPSELNTAADSLSRLYAPVPARLPGSLCDAWRRQAPELDGIFVTAGPVGEGLASGLVV